jgi:hypothetical protein
MSLIRRTITVIRCDHPGCNESLGDDYTTAHKVRAWCREQGWRVDRSGDWCPRHAVAS